MRAVHGLSFILVLKPAGFLSLSIRPLLNTALYLFKKKYSHLATVKHAVGENHNYHCENKSDDWNGHWGEVLMMFDSHVILVTKQCLINSLLDDRVTVWILTFEILLVK